MNTASTVVENFGGPVCRMCCVKKCINTKNKGENLVLKSLILLHHPIFLPSKTGNCSIGSALTCPFIKWGDAKIYVSKGRISTPVRKTFLETRASRMPTKPVQRSPSDKTSTNKMEKYEFGSQIRIQMVLGNSVALSISCSTS